MRVGPLCAQYYVRYPAVSGERGAFCSSYRSSRQRKAKCLTDRLIISFTPGRVRSRTPSKLASFSLARALLCLACIFAHVEEKEKDAVWRCCTI